MNSSSDIGGMIDQLDENLDNLQDALKTILSKSLGELASDYPVLDRAKLYILVTYAIESAIFCKISFQDWVQRLNNCSFSTFDWYKCQGASHIPRT